MLDLIKENESLKTDIKNLKEDLSASQAHTNKIDAMRTIALDMVLSISLFFTF
jgi:hypothetical protein